MGGKFGYQCSEAGTCPDKKCFHRKPHLSRRLTIEHGNYINCSTNFLVCSVTKVFVKCDLIGKLSGERVHAR